jgi:hypothetical protein
MILSHSDVCRIWVLLTFCAYVFKLRSLVLCLPGRPPLFRLIRLYVLHQTQTTDYYSTEERFLAITRDTRYRGSEKSSGQIHLFNIETREPMDRSTGQAVLIALCFFENLTIAFKIYNYWTAKAFLSFVAHLRPLLQGEPHEIGVQSVFLAYYFSMIFRLQFKFLQWNYLQAQAPHTKNTG